MRRTRAKIISTIMVLAMVISTSPEAFAAAIFATPAEGEIFVRFDGHGQYTEVTNAVRTNIAQDANVQDVGRVVVATETDDEDLYFLSQSDYLLRVGAPTDENRTFLHVERTDVDVDNFSADALDQFSLPTELVNRITSVVEGQIAMGNEAFGLSVFQPTISSTSALQSSYSVNGDMESYDEYYTRFGEQFTDSYIKYWNYNCTFSDNSENAYKTASAISSFLLTCAGAASKTVTAYQIGYSALKMLAIALGASEANVGSGYGAIQILVTYDAIHRITYWNIENGIGSDPYVSTCKAWLNTNFTQQTHDDYPGGGFQTQTYLNEEMLSPHYDDPSDWLYNDYNDAAGIIEGPIYHTIHDERYILV